MKANYYFSDNWNGDIKEFETLAEAKQAAKDQYGETVTIHEVASGKIFFAKGSGHVPA